MIHDLVASYKAQISQANDSQKQLQQKTADLQTLSATLEEKLADCQDSLSDKQTEISAVKNELEEYREAHKAAREEIDLLYTRIADLQTEIAQRDEADNVRAELQKQIDVRVCIVTAGDIDADDAGVVGAGGGVQFSAGGVASAPRRLSQALRQPYYGQPGMLHQDHRQRES